MNEVKNKRTLWIAIVSLVFGCLSVFPGGYAYSLLAIILGALALMKISKSKEIFGGRWLATVGIVMGVVGLIIVSIVARKAITRLSEIRVSANEDAAKSRVMTISSAIETYATVHDGKYPMGEFDLINATPPYMDKFYNNKTIDGYKYSLNLNSEGCKIIAIPEDCGVTGIKIFEIEANGYLSEKICK